MENYVILEDVFAELGPKWQSLDRNTQAYIGTISCWYSSTISFHYINAKLGSCIRTS